MTEILDAMKKSFVIFIVFIIYFASCSTTGTARRSASDNDSPRQALRKDRTQVSTNKGVLYGKASYYAEKFHGKATASGETFDMNGMTAAHKTLPFGTICRVTNLENNRQVIVKINDRGPFVGDRILDLSKGAALQLDSLQSGVIDVKIEILEIPD